MVPTLVLREHDNSWISEEQARDLAERIPGARYLSVPSGSALLDESNFAKVLEPIEEFLTGARPVAQLDRVLVTVLFTDIVGSTHTAATLGDRSWRQLLDEHHRLVREELARHRGNEIDTAGDGFLATFDGPGRAIACARAICERVRPLGIEIRAGLHTGEVEVMGDDIGGLAVHIGARVATQAEAGEVLVSRTVTDLVAGSGIKFLDRGEHELKGIPGTWRLFAVLS